MAYVLRFIILAALGTFSVCSAHAQHKRTAISGEGRGGPVGAVQMVRLNSVDSVDAQQGSMLDVQEGRAQARSACGTSGMLWGPGHSLADANDCVGSMRILDNGNIETMSGLQVGESAPCSAADAGAIRLTATAPMAEFCDGTAWRATW